MRLARFDDWQTGLVVGDHLIEVDACTGDPWSSIRDGAAPLDWSRMIERWNEFGPRLAELAAKGEQRSAEVTDHPLDRVDLRAPLPSPHARIFALGANFADHSARAFTTILGQPVPESKFVAEKDQGLPPYGFIVLPELVVGPGAEVAPPPGVEKFDYESEVAVVIRSGGRHLAPDALTVWGYTGWNDLSIRDTYFKLGPHHDRGILVWALQKNFETGNVCGPWMVIDEPVDVNNIAFSGRVNGQIRQKSSTAEMLYSFGETAAHLSRYLELRPGDLLISGTPKGTALEDGIDGPFLRPGDTVEVEVDGVGTLRNTVGSW